MRCRIRTLLQPRCSLIILHFTGRIAVCTGYGTLPITGAFQIELLYNTVQMFQVQFRLIAVHFSAQSGEISRDHIAYTAVCCCHKHGVCFYFTLLRSFQSNEDNKSMPIKTCLICPNINPPRR
jgi:hypothetical protein